MKLGPGRGSAIVTLMHGELIESRGHPLSLLLDLVFGIINLVVFFYISRTVRSPSRLALDGAPTYFAFAAVGISLMLVIQSATVVLVTRLRQEQQQGTLEALVTQPVPVPALSIGLAGYSYAFATLRAAGYLAISAVLLGLSAPRASWLGIVVILVLGTVATMAIGILLCAMAIAVRRGDALARVTVFALGFLSGAFFPVGRLPPALRAVARVSPPRVALDGLRAALFRGSGWEANAGWLVLSGAVMLPLAVLAFAGALRWCIRAGTLSGS
jgi:ABC-type multidrug transport system permease subunit